MTRLPITIARLSMVVLGAAALAVFTAPAPAADEVHVGQVVHRPDRVIGVRGGSLLFETRGGTRRSVPLAQITALRADRYPDLPQADEALEARRYQEAAELYGAMLDTAGEEHMKVWIGVRRVIALERSDRFDEAVDAYMDLAALDQGTLVQAIMPRRVPADEIRRAELAAQVGARIRREADPLVRGLLRELRERIEAGQPTPAADEGDGEMRRADADALPLGRRAQARESVVDRIEAGRYREALEEIEHQIASPRARSSSLPELLYQRGRCLAALDEPYEAALSFMRVIIHYRPHMTDWYVPSLIGAAEVLRDIGQAHHARGLLAEAEGLAGDDEQRAAEIERLLESLPE